MHRSSVWLCLKQPRQVCLFPSCSDLPKGTPRLRGRVEGRPSCVEESGVAWFCAHSTSSLLGRVALMAQVECSRLPMSPASPEAGVSVPLQAARPTGGVPYSSTPLAFPKRLGSPVCFPLTFSCGLLTGSQYGRSATASPEGAAATWTTSVH